MKVRNLNGKQDVFVKICSSTLTLIIFYTAFGGTFMVMVQRSMLLMFMIPLIYLLYPASKKSKSDTFSLLDISLAILIAVSFAWIIFNYPRIVNRIKYASPVYNLDMIFGTIAIVSVIEASRRTLGWIFVIITGFFLAYVFLGPNIPGIFGFRTISYKMFIEHIYLMPQGIFNMLTGLCSTYLYTFLTFGAFLKISGVDKYYMEICLALSGGARGGPAKVAVVSSALMGMMSGSTISNVVLTGSMTIPMMKNTGFTPKEAAAIETSASVGGALTPPIMGAGAFIIAAFTGIPLVKILLISVIPAIMYYVSLYSYIEITAIKHDLKGLPAEEIPSLKKSIMKSIHLFIPLLVLIIFLVKGYTPFWASAIATILIIVLSQIKADTRINISKFIIGLENGCKNMMFVTSIGACAAIIIGVVTLTGISVKISSILIALSNGEVILLLILLALMSYIFGMSMPVTFSYIFVVMLGASALVRLGIPLLSAHLFAFWIAQIATISPPVCMTAFVAAQIAKEPDYMGVGFKTLDVAKALYIIPFVLVYTNFVLHGFLGQILIFTQYLTFIIAINLITEKYFVKALRIYDIALLGISVLFSFFGLFRLFTQNEIINCSFTLIGAIFIIGVYYIQKRF